MLPEKKSEHAYPKEYNPYTDRNARMNIYMVFAAGDRGGFNFNVEDGPHPGYKIRLDWQPKDENGERRCTWLYRLETPNWVAHEKLPDDEGLFIDPYGNMYLFIGKSLEIFPPGHHRNNGSTLLRMTELDI